MPYIGTINVVACFNLTILIQEFCPSGMTSKEYYHVQTYFWLSINRTNLGDNVDIQEEVTSEASLGYVLNGN